MNIILCDNDERFLFYLDNKIRTYMKHSGISYNITHYYSGRELLQCNIHQVDVVFLDIKLHDMNGIEVATMLRTNSDKFVLVFISDFLEYAPMGYEVNAVRYIMKKQIDIKFESTMKAALEKLRYFKIKLYFNFVNGPAEVCTDRIIYIESNLHSVYFSFIGNQEKRYLYKTLNSIQKQLPSDEFVRIHQSYIVNIKYIIDARNYCAFLIDNIRLPISQKKFAYVKKQLCIYKGKMDKL